MANTEMELDEGANRTQGHLLSPEDPEEKGRVVPQFLAAGAANLCAVVLGCILGWTSPSLRHLDEPDSDIKITLSENSWISSLMPLMAAFGPFAAGYMAQNFGRKTSLLIGGVPMILSYICLAAADAVWGLYLGRLLAGLSVGWGFTVLPMYTGEIGTKEYRGALGTIIQFSISIGLIFDYALGPYISFMWLSIASIFFPLLFMVLFFLVPESPYYLVEKGKQNEASKALQWLRGKSAAGVATELKILQTEIEESSRQKGGIRDLVGVKSNRKTMGLCAGLMFFQQFSGINVVLFNAETIFARAGGSVTPAIATIIVGVVMLLSSFPTPILVEKLGRRLLLISSGVGMGISLAILGTCFYLDKQGTDTSSFAFLPVLSVIAFLISYSPGFGPIPWAVSGEMYPPNIKAIASTLTAAFCWLVSFLVTRFFNDLVEAVGDAWTFWIFAIFCAGSVVFVFFLLPETKGKTLAEIQEELS